MVYDSRFLVGPNLVSELDYYAVGGLTFLVVTSFDGMEREGSSGLMMAFLRVELCKNPPGSKRNGCLMCHDLVCNYYCYRFVQMRYRLNSGHASYHALKNCLSSRLLTNTKTKHRHFKYLCGCETWSLVLREEHGLRVFKKCAEENKYLIS